MREILFRGQDSRSKKWIYGYFTGRENSFARIFDTDYFTRFVKPETVGQYTGLTDKNGKKVFEGDIVKTKYRRLCEVRWFSAPCSQCWGLIPIENKHKIPDEYDLWIPKNLEVIGNIHDNFELLNK